MIDPERMADIMTDLTHGAYIVQHIDRFDTCLAYVLGVLGVAGEGVGLSAAACRDLAEGIANGPLKNDNPTIGKN